MTLISVMFVFMAISFGQSNVIKNTTFYLSDGSNISTGLSVAINPTYPTAIGTEGVMIIMFDTFIDFISITNDIIGSSNLVELKLDNGAVYGIKFNYNDMVSGTVVIYYDPTTVFTFLTPADTLSVYNNGLTNGFDAGVKSVDTLEIWNSGYNFGVVEGENTSADDAYNAGREYERNGGTGVNSFAVTNLNVYPNPSSTSGTVTVECDNFNNVKVYTMVGQEIYTSFNNTFNVSDFTSVRGTYVLRVEDNEFNVTNTRLIVQ